MTCADGSPENVPQLGENPANRGSRVSIEPAVAALCGLMFLHEQLTPTQWLALLCVSAASAGTALTVRNPTPAVEA